MFNFKAIDLLEDIASFQESIFTEESLRGAELAYRKLVQENMCKDMESASTKNVEELIDHIVYDLPSPDTVREYLTKLSDQNPNLLAFLFVRFSNARSYLKDLGDGYVYFRNQPKSLRRSVLVELWNESPLSDDKY